MEPPEGICGFELRPEDVGSDRDIEDFRERFGTACCWREVWKDGRCAWHAEVDEKPRDVLTEARRDGWDQDSVLAGTGLSPWEQLEGAYLNGVDLSDFDLHEFCLRVTDLSDASLSEADLSDVNLWDADLSDADLRHADLSDAYLRGADLSDAILLYADLSDAYLWYADLSDAYLWYADLSDAYLWYADLSDADLEGADLSDADLEGADLSDADLWDADLSDADLGGADLPDADLWYADLSDADLGDADLSDADLRHADLSDADLWDADLSKANLRGTTLRDASFDDTTLKNADLSDARIHRCSFEGADLTGAECDGSTFGGNHLYGARLQDVHLSDRTTFETHPGDWFDADPIDRRPLDIPPSIDSREWTVPGPDLEPVDIDDEDHHLVPDPTFVERIRRGVRRTIALYRMDDSDTDNEVTSFEKARNAYRERERLYRENSLTDRVGDAYEGAKRSQHREALAKGNWFSYVGLAARRWTMGYGERPWRLVGMSALLIVGSAVFYPMLGGVQIGEGSGTIVGGSILSRIPPLVPDAVASVPLVEPLAHHGSVFLTSLYFSVITFTTLGYGGI